MKLRLVPVKFALWAICLFPGTEILAERGGVLFYVSFDGNGTAVGTDHVSPDVRCGNGKLNFQAGKRGKALRSGDGLGLPYYSPRGHVYPQQGSVEFWVCPLDWTPGDEKFHSFFQIQSPGFINIYKYHQSQQLLFRMGALYTDEKKVKVEIDFDGLMSRIVAVPVDPGNYFGLNSIKNRIFYLSWKNRGMLGHSLFDDDDRGLTLHRYNIKKQKHKQVTSNVQGYDISGDGKKLIIRSKGKFTIQGVNESNNGRWKKDDEEEKEDDEK